MQRILKTAAGQMLFDPDRTEPPKVEYFDPDWWRVQSAIDDQFEGRSQTIAVDSPYGPAVLKQYFRGGLIRRFSRSSYLYLGAVRTRGFLEWRVTRRLWQAGLPVTEPLAAFFRLSLFTYGAALLTRRIETSVTLADRAHELKPSHWKTVGGLIARFAAAGLQHPDLNARNILIDANEALWWIDFDRARIGKRPVDPEAMHQRLLRSLNKLEIVYDARAIASGISEAK